jgi:chromosome segregation ATPase
VDDTKVLSERVVRLESKYDTLIRDIGEVAKRMDIVEDRCHRDDLEKQTLNATIQRVESMVKGIRDEMKERKDTRWKTAPIIISALALLTGAVNVISAFVR